MADAGRRHRSPAVRHVQDRRARGSVMAERSNRPPVRIHAEVIDSGKWADLSPRAAKLAVVLLKHVGRDGLCWPSATTIKTLAGMSRSVAYEALNELKQAGFLTTEKRGGGRAEGGTWASTVRRLTVRDGGLINPPTVRQTGRQPSGSPDANRPADRTQPSAMPDTNHSHEPAPKNPSIEQGTDGASRDGEGDALGHVTEAELTDIHRLIDRYCRWRGCDPPGAIDDDILRFVAAAIHAANVQPKSGEPIRNRPALFASIIRSGGKSKITQATEEEAHRRLAEYFHGPPREQQTEPAPAPPGETDDQRTDAEIAEPIFNRQHGDQESKTRALNAELRRRGWNKRRRDAAIQQIRTGTAERQSEPSTEQETQA